MEIKGNTKYLVYLGSDEWKEIARARMEIDDYTCQCCGSRGTAQNPLEVHHLSYKYIYHEKERVQEDLVTLCHICHLGVHNMMNRTTNVETGRKGWRDSNYVPRVHTFNLGGSLEYRSK